MTNKDIINIFKLTSKILELHDANPFKVRAFTSIVFTIENTSVNLNELTEEQLLDVDGIKKGMASKIKEICDTGSFTELNELLADTPAGVIEMLDIKGIGPKKIKILWRELGIVDTKTLLKACQDDEISKVKGFGAKTQTTIIEGLLFAEEQIGKYRYADIIDFAETFKKTISNLSTVESIALTGQVARCLEIVDILQVTLSTKNVTATSAEIASIDNLNIDEKNSGPFVVRGNTIEPEVNFEIKLTTSEAFERESLVNASSPAHLAFSPDGNDSLLKSFRKETGKNATELYQAVNMHFMPPEVREGQLESKYLLSETPPELLKFEDLKGSLHNHCTYSDGKNTLEEMAVHCRDLGYEYLGISDHSVTAFYASGLNEDRVAQQQKEIDELNIKLAPFKIFKGIESDILADGSLDYSNEVLDSFDFIVSSIHANLNMDIEKATTRLLKAVENPYTTILGHMTGRLLLKRDGYPIDHKMVIDACAANNVIIEINASPWRLDIDWRYIDYALSKGVMLSINPDAHEVRGYGDMYFGTLAGRKGGLTKDMTLNTMSLEEITTYFEKRKSGIAITA